MISFDAFHLPALDAETDVAEWDVRGAGESLWRVPRLRPGALARLCTGLLEARERSLAHRSLADIIRAIDAAAARLGDADDPLGRTARSLLPAVTGYAPEMCELMLAHAVADWRAPALERLIRAEFGDAAVLDGFAHDPIRDTLVHAAGPRLAWHVFSGNIPGVGVTSLVRALLVRGSSIAKSSSREPVLGPLFARALTEVDPGLGGTIAVTWWPGGDMALEAEVLAAADVIIFYGGERAAASVRERVPPGVPLLEHGPRASFGMVGREALCDEATAAATAAQVARATALFDQQGCVSPQLIYVEEGAAIQPRAFATLVAAGLEEARDSIPRGRIDAAGAAAIHELRAASEFRAIAGQDIEVFASADTAATVIYEGDPAFTGSPLNRVLRVKPVSDLGQVAALVQPFRAVLQTAAITGAGLRTADIALALARAGVTRITDFEAMPFPPPTWHHDGRGPLRELVRWVDRER
jgi:hypothetical protein